MKNSTPILVLTGLAIAAAVGIAGLTREQWTVQPTPAVVTAEPASPPASATAEAPPTAPEAPPAAEQAPAAATAPAEQTAATPVPEQTAEPAAAASSEQMAAAPSEPAAPPEPEPEPEPAPKVEVPTFDTVRLEKTGEAVIAGRAQPGSEVIVKLNGEPLGKTVANADGAFVLIPEKPLPAGSGAITIEATGKGDLQPVTSEQSVAVIVPEGQPQQALVAVVSPNAPTKVLQKPEPVAAEPAPATPEPAAQPAAEQKPAKLVSIDAVDYDPSGNIVFSGQGETGNTARIYVDNAFLGDAPVGEDGRWSFSGTANVAQGVHTLRVDGLDAKGSVLNRVEVPFFREEQTKVADATPPAAPAATEPSAADTMSEAPEQPAAAAPEQPQASQTAEASAAGQETMQQPEETTAATAAETTPDGTGSEVPKEGRIVIQPGNNLWRISRVLYGTGSKFTMLYEANKEQIRNPNLIYPGQVFRTPGVAPKAETVDPNRRDPLAPDENAATAE